MKCHNRTLDKQQKPESEKELLGKLKNYNKRVLVMWQGSIGQLALTVLLGIIDGTKNTRANQTEMASIMLPLKSFDDPQMTTLWSCV